MTQLTKEQASALNRIWDQIAPDVLDCCGDEEDGSELSRDEVIEIVMDADRPTNMFPNVDWSSFYAMSRAERIVAARMAFPYESYC
jgi:hypothetical protein